MVPCPSSKTLGPATNNSERHAQITSVSTFTQECPDFLPSCQDYSCSCRYAGIFVRGKLRNSAVQAGIGLILQGTVRRGRSRPRAPFAWAPLLRAV